MKNPFFTPGRWVRFIKNEEVCIGRTYLHERTEPEEVLYHLVSYITPSGDYEIVSYYECIDIRYLRLAYEKATLFELKFQNEPLTRETWYDLIIDPNITKQRTFELAQSQENQKN